MAIVGLTNNRAASFPRIGILRKGDVKPTTGNAPGRDLDHFRFVADDEDLVREFHDQFGEKPRSVDVFLPFASADENFQAFREDWLRGGLVHRCDGEKTVLIRKGDGYSTEPVKCPGGCKAVGRLTVWIPAFRRLAFITVLTTSKWDILTLTENLRAMELIRPDLRGIPLTIRRRPRDISVPSTDKSGAKTRSRMTKWLLSIEPSSQWVGYQLAAMERAALPAGAAPLALPSPSGFDGLAELGNDDQDDAIDAVVEHRPSNGHARPNAATQRVVNGDEPIRDRVDFWTRSKALRTPPFTNEDIHQILRVASLKDWLAAGGTWESAYDEVYRAVVAEAIDVEPPDEDEESPTIETPSGTIDRTSGEIVAAKPTNGTPPMSQAEWATFNQWCKDHDLNKEDVLGILKVAKLRDYTGTMTQAQTAVERALIEEAEAIGGETGSPIPAAEDAIDPDAMFNSFESATKPRLAEAVPLPTPDDPVKRRQLADQWTATVDEARRAGVDVGHAPDFESGELAFLEGRLADLHKAIASKAARSGKQAVAAK